MIKRTIAWMISLIFVMLAFAACTHVHSFGEWEVEREATCGASGLKKRYCDCGDVERRSVPAVGGCQYSPSDICVTCKMPKGGFIDENGTLFIKGEDGLFHGYDDLPLGLDYHNVGVNMLVWNTERPEFIATELSTDARTEAIYKRNDAIETRLGVKLNMVTETAGNGEADTYAKRVQSMKNAGLHDFDILACYSRTAGTLLSHGAWYNLKRIEESYLDFRASRWSYDLIDNGMIKNAIYYVSGKISMTAIDQMTVVFFNKQKVNQDFADRSGASATGWLYERYLRNEWTVDLFVDLLANTHKDNDDNGVSPMDEYGLAVGYRGIAAMYSGTGLRMITRDYSSGDFELANDLSSANARKLALKLGGLMSSGNVWGEAQAAAFDEDPYAPFYRGNACFMIQKLEVAGTNLKNNAALVDGYGILPLPMLEGGKQNYCTVMDDAFSVFGIYSGFDTRGDKAATARMLSAVLEYWASESDRRCVPVAVNEHLPKESGFADRESSILYHMTRNMVLDPGRVFPQILSGGAADDTEATPDVKFAMACINNTDWKTVYDGFAGEMALNLADFMSKLKAGTLG